MTAVCTDSYDNSAKGYLTQLGVLGGILVGSNILTESWQDEEGASGFGERKLYNQRHGGVGCRIQLTLLGHLKSWFKDTVLSASLVKLGPFVYVCSVGAYSHSSLEGFSEKLNFLFLSIRFNQPLFNA